MFVKLSDVDLDATLAKAEIKYDKRKKSICEFLYECGICVCMYVCVRSSVGPHWHCYRFI